MILFPVAGIENRTKEVQNLYSVQMKKINISLAI
jgi:hypothetical protein